jgi:hypothetical protein
MCHFQEEKMPDYYAHLTFGEKVLMKLPGPLQSRIGSQIEAYICGQYGPDPLFFLNGRTRAIAQRMHRNPVKLPVANLSGAVARGDDQADGYAAGFLCHFVLDSVCHPYVSDKISRSHLNHTAIEAEFDRFLMARRGILALKRMPMPPMSRNYNVYSAGATPYGITAATYNHSLAAFRLVAGAITVANGTPLGTLVNALGTAATSLSSLKGAVASTLPSQEAHDSNRALSVLLEGAVDGCCELIEDFFCQADRGDIFYTPQLEENFYGGTGGKIICVSLK